MILLARRAAALIHGLAVARGERRPYLVPANACHVIVLALAKAGVGVELVDISPESLSMDVGRALSTLRKAPGRYGGLIFVRTYGSLADESGFFREARRHAPHIHLVDDRCLAEPDFEATPPEGVDEVLFSTGYAKVVDVGWGGFAVSAGGPAPGPGGEEFDPTELDLVEARAKAALASGRSLGDGSGAWLDLRRPPIGLDEYRGLVVAEHALRAPARAALNGIYRATLRPELQLRGDFHRWRFNILVENKDEVVAALFEAGLFASGHYASLAPAYTSAPMPIAAALHKHVVNLFADRHFDAERASRASAIVNRVARPLREGMLKALVGA